MLFKNKILLPRATLQRVRRAVYAFTLLNQNVMIASRRTRTRDYIIIQDYRDERERQIVISVKRSTCVPCAVYE